MSYFNNGSGAEVLEENNYYPFGLKHEGYNALAGNPSYQYKFNEKELQTETGWSDYGWRQYMPEIGKWNGMDQLSEKYYSTSPFAYVANNPISSFDVDGRWFNEDGNIDKSGNPTRFTSAKEMYAQFLGIKPGEGGGGSGAGFGDGGGDLWTGIKDFFNGIFGKKKGKNPVHGTVDKSTVFIPVGQVMEESTTAESMTALMEEISGALRVVGVTVGRAGLWSLPLMLNGDSGFTANTTLPLDVPITTTDDKPEQTMTLFRGVHGKHPDLINAYMGNAYPWGGSFTAEDHNAGHNNSMFTSWTTSIDMANYSASRRGPGGIILKQTFPIWRLSFFDRHGEGEVQVLGPVTGAQTIKPWNSGTWTPYLK